MRILHGLVSDRDGEHWIQLALLVSLFFSLLLPSLDHHAIEREPNHVHLLAGADSTVAPHNHLYNEPHTDWSSVGAQAADTGASRVIVAQSNSSGSFLTVDAGALVPLPLLYLVPLLLTTELPFDLASLFVSNVPPLLPPPPRAS